MRQLRHGCAIAIALAEGGVHLAVNYRENKYAADEVVGGDHEVLTRDRDRSGCRRPETGRLADPGDRQSQDGEVNILLNCAGITRHKRLDNVDLITFDETINVDLRSAFLVESAVVPAMPRDKWGRLIFISSTAANAGGAVGPH